MFVMFHVAFNPSCVLILVDFVDMQCRRRAREGGQQHGNVDAS